MPRKTLRFGPVNTQIDVSCYKCKGEGTIKGTVEQEIEGRTVKAPTVVECHKCKGSGTIKKLEVSERDIPDGTTVRIVALPANQIIHEFRDVGGEEFSVDLQPGKYRYSMVHFIHGPGPDGPPCVETCTGEFLHEITEAQFRDLQNRAPNFARFRMTSDGPRWNCTFPGCSKRTDTRVSAYIHEAKVHYGIDPLQPGSKPALSEAEAKAAALANSMRLGKKAERAGQFDPRADEPALPPQPGG